MSKRASQRESVRVVCRVRPTNQKETSSGGVQCVKYSESGGIDIHCDDGSHSFSFDRVFGPDSEQLEVFEYTAVPLISDVLQGYNATIFAYGQTGTGKTHTMEGDIRDSTKKGIIPRSVEALFEGVLEADENIEFTFKVSYVEIYMEKIRDLLDENRLKNNLTVREDKIKGIYIAGVTEEYVTSHEELLGIMSAGAANRAVAATGMNEGSSRSHSVFTITVGQRDLTNNTTKSGKLVLVDLAGSEMVRKSNASGQQLEEAKTINKSLSALGQVINALTDEKQTHVPYRDSKLTRILQDSLGGNSKTVLIVAVSPSSFNANETVSTLRFGTRAKSIENKVTVNQTRSVEELEGLLVRAEKAIDTQMTHIMALTAQLQAFQLGKEPSGGMTGVEESEGNANAVAAIATAAAAEAAKVEAEGQLQALQEVVLSLTQELEEERTESTRKDTEIDELGQMLKSKEKLFQEAGELLLEAQRHYEAQRDRAEGLVREKAELMGEVEGLRTQMNEELSKAKFDLKELEVTIETLRTENQQLQQEIAEMSGDATVGRSNAQVGVAGDTPIKTTNSNPSSPTNTTPHHPKAQEVQFGDENDEQIGDGKSNISQTFGSSTQVSILKSADRSHLLEESLSKIALACAKHGIVEEVAAEFAIIMRDDADRRDAAILAAETRNVVLEKGSSDNTRRIRDMEVQRSRLEKDLAGRTEKLSKLQFEMDALRGMDGVSASEYLSDRERAQMRSLQQRLEQLVVVHRQLLRKFASLELENGEFRKKITLRDERIKQLENSSRGLTSNMRNQAERHVAELTNLREQIQVIRADHYRRMEAKEQDHGMAQHRLGHADGPRTLRGGHGDHSAAAPKSLRGGRGSVVSNAVEGIVSDSVPMSPVPARSSIFSRLLGGGPK